MTPEEELEQRFADAKSLAEKQEIASEFIDKKYPSIDYKDILVKLCTELDELNNYFTKYNDLYTKLEGIIPTRNLMVAMNNLYASSVVDDNDLDGTGENGRDSIIFKSSLADDKLSPSDIEFVVKSYAWLSQKENIKKMNFNAMLALANRKDDKAYENLIIVCNEALQNPDTYNSIDVRNAIMYKDDRGNIRSKKEIEDILHMAASKLNSTNNNEDKVLKTISDISKMSDDEKAELFKQLGVKPE